jgi:hypothetical protein
VYSRTVGKLRLLPFFILADIACPATPFWKLVAYDTAKIQFTVIIKQYAFNQG